MMPDQQVQTILSNGEKVSWRGGVNRTVIGINLALSLILFLAISGAVYSVDTINYFSNDFSRTISGSTVATLILIFGCLFSVLIFFSNYVKEFVITDKRVLIKSGIIGTDFNSIYFTEIKSANVNVGLVDKLLSVGTINIDTGKVSSTSDKNGVTSVNTVYDKLLHIDAPYEVYKYFQEALTGRQESLYSGRADQENLAVRK
ncbi:MAG: PH domain-containing protein [Candidatus Falkowbacteria bacterium]|nr:MAG: PH domain-containing protein [Candidatus Falkowbacteria bacterium]